MAASSARAQPQPIAEIVDTGVQMQVRCGGPFQLCGYIEKETERLLIPQHYEVAKPFHDGLAAVRVDGHWGYINEKGEMVIKPQFQLAGPFQRGLAEVQIDKASGIIDGTGRFIVPAQFSRILPLTKDVFIAQPIKDGSKWDDRYPPRLSDEGASRFLWGDAGAGLYHRDKGWITEQNFKFTEFDETGRGLLWAAQRQNRDGYVWGLMRADGSWQVTPRYDHVQQLQDGFAVVKSLRDRSLPIALQAASERWGAVDKDGSVILPLKYDYLSNTGRGYFYTRLGQPDYAAGKYQAKKEALVRSDGSLLAGRYFDEIDMLDDSILPRGRIAEKWYSIKADGQLAPDQLDGKPMVECPGGVSIIRRGEKVDILKSDNETLIGRFDMGYYSRLKCGKPFGIERDGRYFLLMPDGRVLGGKAGFDGYDDFKGDHAAVQQGGKWGIMDQTGQFTVRPRFDELRSVRDDRFEARLGKDQYWINAAGARVAKPEPKKPNPKIALTCPGGLQYFQKDTLWGLQDSAGKTVIEPQYRALSCFKEGVAWAAKAGASRWCPIGPDGSERKGLPCLESYYLVEYFHHYPQRLHENRFESSVLWNRALLDYFAGKRKEAPLMIGDGVMGIGEHPVDEDSVR